MFEFIKVFYNRQRHQPGLACGCPKPCRGRSLGRIPAILMSMCRILYTFLSAMARLAVRSGRSKDLEIIVLRHQLTVLRRQVNRPAIDDDDRTLLAAIAAAPARLRHGWVVTPDTLLRRHRKRIARH